MKSSKSGARRKRGRGSKAGPIRRFLRRFVAVFIISYLLLSIVGCWYVSHPWQWISDNRDDLPSFVVKPLEYFGDRTKMISDGLGFTGQDAVYDLDEPPPSGSVFFAGPPIRTGAPAVSDVQMIDRGEFVVGWSASLKHPLWVAYHVPSEKAYEAGRRPSFRADPSVSGSPSASAYKGTGYDRGHMAPNYAIATRFGTEAQKKTFYMSNISPQRPGLNRGPWREVEHRIADLWTAKYGDIWVIVGCVPGSPEETLPSGVDVPKAYWQLIVSNSSDGVRALALYMPKDIPFSAFPVHNIVSIDELESRTGLDFLAELPNFFEKPIESHLPTRLWPVRFIDLFRLIGLRFI